MANSKWIYPYMGHGIPQVTHLVTATGHRPIGPQNTCEVLGYRRGPLTPTLTPTSQPELGTNTNTVSLRAPNRPLSGSVAFLGHLGLNTVQKSNGKAKNPLNGARP
jgi:hypothetical protein